MNITALITVRNGACYVDRCLQHLISQGIDVVLIDNDSEDDTVKIAEKYKGRGLNRLEHLPYNGSFQLAKVLENEQAIANEIGADWVMHYDIDEICESPFPGLNLRQAIEFVDSSGYNAINFDEFVFTPTDSDQNFAKTDYVGAMLKYYYFCPRKLHRVKAWKHGVSKIDLITHGGHNVQFDQIKIYPIYFILRHYVALSWTQLVEKYATRIYDEDEVKQRGWHINRVGLTAQNLRLPLPTELCEINAAGGWDRTRPQRTHLFSLD